MNIHTLRKKLCVLWAVVLLVLPACQPEEEPVPVEPDMAASVVVAHGFATQWAARDPIMLWNWGEFVLLYGMWKVYETTGDETIRDYIGSYYDSLHENYEPIASDWFSPATLGLLLCEDAQDPTACANVDTYDAYFDTAKRVEDILVHWSNLEGNAGEIWVDTLVMACSYEIERGRYLDGTARDRWFDDLVVQFEGFDTYLTDADSGLLNHAYDFAEPDAPFKNGAGAFWGRGNGWYIAALGNFLKRLPTDDRRRPAMEALWLKRVQSVLDLQDAQGFWHTILPRNDDDYIETSATALIVAGIAAGLNAGVDTGTLGDRPAQVAETAMLALDNHIDMDSEGNYVLPDVSVATNPGTYEDYLAIGVQDNVHYGIGSYLWAAVEMAELRGELD